MKYGKKYLKEFLSICVIFSIFALLVYLAGGKTFCFFQNVYGIPCPGCGLGRSFICLFNGNIYNAFYYHPLFPLVILIGIVLLFRKIKYIDGIYKSQSVWIGVVGLFMLVWIFRMIFFFPHTSPMTITHNSLLFQMIGFLGNICN
jgi:hypothetical protein